jgi:hypothetical protein
MDHATLLAQLIATEPFDQLELLARYPNLCDVKLARALHAAGQAAWNSEPTRMLCVASALRALAERTSDAEIIALAEWMDGVAALVEGRMESALMQFDRAAQRFEALGLRSDAAATRVPKLMALGMLARFDEAIETGLCARE